MDFGWVDPTAMLKIHLDKNRKKIYVYDEIYQQYMTDENIISEAKKFCNNEYVRCDDAEPRIISMLVSKGVRAIEAGKGATTIIDGIRWLQGYEIIVDIRCQNFKNEIEAYHWKEDKYGNVLETPVDQKNHLLDCLRYALIDEIVLSRAAAAKRI